MTCSCAIIQKVTGNEARAYSKQHLIRLAVRADGWIMLYKCPDTGALWKREWPHSSAHGGGTEELYQIALAQARVEFGIPK